MFSSYENAYPGLPEIQQDEPIMLYAIGRIPCRSLFLKATLLCLTLEIA